MTKTNDAPAAANAEAREAAYKAAWEAGRLSDLGWEAANQNATPLSLLADFIVSCKAMVDATLNSPAPAPSGSGVRIKPLEWVEQSGRGTTWRAESSFGRYLIYMRPDNSWAFEPPFLFGGKVGFRSPNEAMAAAQADFDQRIRASLASDASPSGDVSTEVQRIASRLAELSPSSGIIFEHDQYEVELRWLTDATPLAKGPGHVG